MRAAESIGEQGSRDGRHRSGRRTTPSRACRSSSRWPSRAGSRSVPPYSMQLACKGISQGARVLQDRTISVEWNHSWWGLVGGIGHRVIQALWSASGRVARGGECTAGVGRGRFVNRNETLDYIAFSRAGPVTRVPFHPESTSISRQRRSCRGVQRTMQILFPFKSVCPSLVCFRPVGVFSLQQH